MAFKYLWEEDRSPEGIKNFSKQFRHKTPLQIMALEAYMTWIPVCIMRGLDTFVNQAQGDCLQMSQKWESKPHT